MTNKTKIYISGKISGEIEEAEKRFEKAEKGLKKLGYEVVNPMKLPHNHDKSWESYMRECIKALMDCTHIYLIRENITSSKGVQIEINLALQLDIKIWNP
jgi:Asp-tRNA(Asn)/Glu-tRNA(Gln) amidotransferase A subunit family amidase